MMHKARAAKACMCGIDDEEIEGGVSKYVHTRVKRTRKRSRKRVREARREWGGTRGRVGGRSRGRSKAPSGENRPGQGTAFIWRRDATPRRSCALELVDSGSLPPGHESVA